MRCPPLRFNLLYPIGQSESCCIPRISRSLCPPTFTPSAIFSPLDRGERSTYLGAASEPAESIPQGAESLTQSSATTRLYSVLTGNDAGIVAGRLYSSITFIRDLLSLGTWVLRSLRSPTIESTPVPPRHVATNTITLFGVYDVVVVARVGDVVAVLVDVVSPAAHREWHWYGWHLGDPSTVDHGVVDGGLVVSWATPGSLARHR
jgi:hypothetical protein